VLFQAAYRRGDEELVKRQHQLLKADSVEDELCLAAMHYHRGHYNKAVDLYKALILKNR